MTPKEYLARFGDAANCCKHLERSRRELLAFLGSLSDEQLQNRLEPEVWSPAEVAEHIALTEESAGKVIRRLRKVIQEGAAHFPPVPPVQTRSDGRLIAPDAVQPQRVLPRGELLEHLHSIRERVIAEVEASGDLLESPTTYAHPFFGELTALGWLQTLVYHERHHLKQIQDRMKT